MRVVLDTNVILSAFLWGGTPGKLFDLALDGSISLISSTPLLTELNRVLLYPRVLERLACIDKKPLDVLSQYESFVELVKPAIFPAIIITSDPPDDVVLQTAVGGNARYIVSGNKHLLHVGEFNSIRIITPAQFISHSRSH
jgi:putative PIN family toxin of toxin-antitoxin system